MTKEDRSELNGTIDSRWPIVGILVPTLVYLWFENQGSNESK